MKAMILAAGRGERMRPLTDHTHKSLLKVAGVPLLERHIKNLALAGIQDIIINVSYLADQIVGFLGSGEQYGVNIYYSVEDFPLEVGGGIINALPLLGDDPFITINSDVWTDFPLEKLPTKLKDYAGHLVLVDNPVQHPHGDFHLRGNTVEKLDLIKQPKNNYTFAGIAIYHPRIFQEFLFEESQPMLPILLNAISQNELSGELYTGKWHDIGTPERLAAVNRGC